MTLLRFYLDLCKEPVERPWEGRGYLLIDEAQDVTRMQAALIREFAKRRGFAIRVYGDPNQQISHEYDAPLFSDLAPQDMTVLEGTPGYKRVPRQIAELAWGLDPSMPHWESWANLDEPGEIRPFERPIYPVFKGISMSESRARTRTCSMASPKSQIALSPRAACNAGWDLERNPVFCTIHAAKGWEAETVTVQRWQPGRHQARIRRGEITAIRQLFTALTRCKRTLYIHQEMLELCKLRSTELASSA